MHLVHHRLHREGAQDPVSITVIGAGGNGSHFLYALAALQDVLLQLRGQMLEVNVIDFDKVEKHNCGRQLYFSQEIGMNKAKAITGRINRSYGYDWSGEDYKVTDKPNGPPNSNIVVTCVDNIATRKIIAGMARNKAEKKRSYHDHETWLYWLDLGNGKSTGNIVLGTVGQNAENSLPDVFGIFPGLGDQQEDDTPSCGMAEALLKQDLYINKVVATMACHLLKELFTKSTIEWHGAVVDIEEIAMMKIPC